MRKCSVGLGWAPEGTRPWREANTAIPGTGPSVFSHRKNGVQILAVLIVYVLVIVDNNFQPCLVVKKPADLEAAASRRKRKAQCLNLGVALSAAIYKSSRPSRHLV